MDGQDCNITSLWTHQPTRKYIINQIIESDLKVFKITSHHLYLSFQVPKNQQIHHETKFILCLTKAYPVSPPQVYSASSFITPSIKGYRDYLKPILKQNWHHSFHLKIIKPKTQQFLRQLFEHKGDRSYFSELGEYHKNTYYDYSLLKQLSQHGPYVAFETAEEEVRFYIISITTTHFVIFKPKTQPFFQDSKLIVPKENQITSMKIAFVAKIQCIKAIIHNRRIKSQFTFQFFGKSFSDSNQYHTCHKTLQISKSGEMIGSLMKQMKFSKILIDQIDLKAQKNSQQEELLSEVRLLQQKLQHFFNKTTVRALNDAYQKLVEHYSSVGLPYQQVFLNKMMNLQIREDINILMSNPSPQKKRQ